jgi:TetR/AcrR family transcriptional regulator, transcriptional repressor for nem operon
MATPATGVRAAAKRATRDSLVDAAVAELFEHGVAGSSLDAICARAGYTRGAFYVHFRDREELMIAAMDRVLGDLMRGIATAGAVGASGLAAGIAAFSASAAERIPSIHSGKGLRFHQLLEACRSSPAIGDRYRAILAGAAGWARAGVVAEQRAGGRLAGLDADAIAEVLLAVGLGVVVMFELELPVAPRRVGETMLALLGLGAAGAAQRARGARAAPPRRRPPRRRRR